MNRWILILLAVVLAGPAASTVSPDPAAAGVQDAPGIIEMDVYVDRQSGLAVLPAWQLSALIDARNHLAGEVRRYQSKACQ